MRTAKLFVVVIIMVAAFGFGSYVIRTGDLLSISVYGQADLSSEVLVGPDGTISVPPIGRIDVVDKTLDELSRIIAAEYLEKGILNFTPQLTISIKEYSPYVYYALGELNNPGVFSINKPSMNLSAIIALAGGLTQKADLRKAFVMKKDGEKLPIDLSKLIKEGEGADTILTSGDSLFIPDGYDSWITTMGEFNAPGMVKYENGLTLTRAIAISNGLTSNADSEELVLLSSVEGKLKRFTYDLNQIFNCNSPDPLLEPGTTIIARNVYEKSIKVLGEVNSPGTFEYRKPATLLKLLGDAGGLTGKAAVDVIILREGSQNQYTYELDKILAGAENDIELLPGDTILFPRNSERYVYIVSNEKSGRIDFTDDEKMTIRNALTRNSLYFPQKNIELKILSGDTSFTKNMKELDNNDIEIDSGTLILLPESNFTVSVLGEFLLPGLKKFEKYEEPTLSSAIAMAGGLKENVEQLTIISGESIKVISIEDVFSGKNVLKSGDVIYADRVPERYVYVISNEKGGRVDFSRNEKQTIMNALAKMNLLNSKYGQPITIISPDGSRRFFDTSDLPEKDFSLDTGSVVSCNFTDRNIFVMGYVKNPGLLTLQPDERDLRTIIAAAGGLLPGASASIMVIDAENSTSTTFDFKKTMETGNKIEVSYGSTVYVPKEEQKYAYIIGEVRNPGIIFFEDVEKLTLGSLISRAGGVTEKADGVEITTMGETRLLDFKDYEEVIESGSLVYINRLEEKFVYLVTENGGGKIEISAEEELTIRAILGKANLLNPDNSGELKIVNPDGSKWSCSIASLINEDYSLSTGTVVIYPEINKDFYILGSVVKPGEVNFEIKETPYLSKLIALAGGYNDNADLREIQIINSNEVACIDLQRIMSGNAPDPIVEPESIVIVPAIKERYVYVVSDQTGGKAIFSIEEKITLRNTLARFNLLDLTSNKTVLIINPDGTRQETNLSDLEREDVALESGTIVYYPDTARQFIVLGAVKKPGIVVLKQGQIQNLSTIISLAGGTNENAIIEKIRITDTVGRSKDYNFEEILLGKKIDVFIQEESVIYVPEYVPISVNVLGEVNKPGTVLFKINDEPTLLKAIAEAGGLKDTAAGEVKISRTTESYKWMDLIAKENILLENGSTVYIPAKEEKYVYVVGKVQKPGKVEFSNNETLNLLTAINKSGGPLDIADSEFKVISPAGDVNVFNYEQLTDGKNIEEVINGSTLIFNEKVKRITIIGEVKQPGSYVFTRFEKTSLTDVLARAGGLISPDNIEKIAVSSDGYNEYVFDVFEMNNIEIGDGAIVYAVASEEKRITVLGFVENPGTFNFNSSRSLNLAEVLSLAGGVKSKAEILIINTEGTIARKLSDFDAIDLVKVELSDGDTVVVGSMDKDFITVIGDVNKPGLYDITLYGGNLSLGEALALAGGLKNQKTTGQVNISKGTALLSYTVSPENFSSQTMLMIEPGSIVYVPPRDFMKVYVFGEVKDPGIIQYTDAMTAIEAVLIAGGPTENGVLGNVLLFRGDLSTIPMVINLEQKKEMPLSGNVSLEPGNIIYVPPSNLIDIKEALGIIASSLALINNAISIVK